MASSGSLVWVREVEASVFLGLVYAQAMHTWTSVTTGTSTVQEGSHRNMHRHTQASLCSI